MIDIPTTAHEPLTEAEEAKIYQPEQEWSDSFALKVAVQDFNAAEVFRNQNHDWRWRAHFSLYEAYVEQKVWEGTRIPRSSLPVYLCFEQVESMLPKILSQIFSESPWFQADPEPGTTAEQARQVRDLLLSQMDQAGAREVIRRWLKSGLIHGNGIMGLSWLQREKKRKKYVPMYQPEYQMIQIGGQQLQSPFPTGMKRVLSMKEFTEIENRPELNFILLSDFYVDANCPSPNPQHARYVVQRHLLSVDEVDAMRGDKRFKIPPKDVLIQMAKYKTSTQGDVTKSASETARSGFWNPASDETSDPGGKRIEVLHYWSVDRCVYVLNREWLAYNEINPFGFIPYYDFAYADVLGRFYAMGMCDVLEGEQRFRTSLRNARTDEISLNIHRPMIKRRGITLPASMMRQRPGQILEADNPKDDYAFPDPPNMLAAAYIEDNYSSSEAQKITGLSDLIASGMPQAGGNSASRTATGIGAQVTAGNARIQYLIENAEDSGIEPMLRDLMLLNQLYPPVNQGQEPGQSNYGAELVINSNIKFKMRASAKMQSRMALMQVFPLVAQTFLNPALMAQLGEQNEALNIKEFINMMLDMTGYKNRADLIRPLTPQEQQARKQPPPEEMLRMQMQKERLASQEKTTTQKLQAKAEGDSEKSEMDLVKAIMGPAIKATTEEPKKK